MPTKVEQGLENTDVTTLYDEARFIMQSVLQVDVRELHAKYFHIATGARPITLGFDGEEFFTTSTEFLNFKSIPQCIVFVGGGFNSTETIHHM